MKESMSIQTWRMLQEEERRYKKINIFTFMFIVILLGVGVWYVVSLQVRLKDMTELVSKFQMANIELMNENSCYKTFRVLPVMATVYNNVEEQTDSSPDITATNKRVRKGIVAVSKSLRKYIPLGSLLVCGENTYEVEDVTSDKVEGNVVDFFSFTERDYKEKGVILVPMREVGVDYD